MKTVLERQEEIQSKEKFEIASLDEQCALAEELGMKSVARAMRLRHRFKIIKALNYPIVSREEIQNALNIDPEKEELGESCLGKNSYNMEQYIGLMPYGAMLVMKDLIDNKICTLEDFYIYYPQDIKKKDPILCIKFPNMDKVSRTSEGQLLECALFKVWQWE